MLYAIILTEADGSAVGFEQADFFAGFQVSIC